MAKKYCELDLSLLKDAVDYENAALSLEQQHPIRSILLNKATKKHMASYVAFRRALILAKPE